MAIFKTVQVKPSKRQENWQKLEFYGFIHFGMNTMTNQEWGTGKENSDLFNPENVNCSQ